MEVLEKFIEINLEKALESIDLQPILIRILQKKLGNPTPDNISELDSSEESKCRLFIDRPLPPFKTRNFPTISDIGDIKRILKDYPSVKQENLARFYNLSGSCVSRIKHGVTYSDVSPAKALSSNGIAYLKTLNIKIIGA